MSRFLLKFEAIESRIASFPCPSGTTGRVHSLRLRRQFHDSKRLPTTFAASAREIDPSNPPIDLRSHDSTARDGVTDRANETVVWMPQDKDSLGRTPGKQFRRVGIPELAHLKISGSARKVSEDGDVQALEVAHLEPAQLVSRLQAIVRIGDSYQVLGEILGQIKSIGPQVYAQTVLATMPAATFSEVLRALDPKHFVGRFSEVYEEISPNWANILRLPPVNSHGHHEFLSLFLKHISITLYTRELAQPLALSDYRLLLKCARVAGDPDTAKFIWKRLQHQMHQDLALSDRDPAHQVIAPDVECYNHYMATLCWSEMLNPYQRHRLRITKRNFLPRSMEANVFALAGHKVGPGGLKATVASLFQRMVQQKVQPNEETLCLMIISIAREGELGAISSILKRAWTIDVEAVLNSEDTEGLHAKPYPPSDPLCPTDHLLMALAHAYSINNSISTAIQLVDYVSRQYNIAISRKIWSELLERSVMLSGRSQSDNGQLPHSAVANLWNTMTGEPYNVEPDLRMYNLLIGSLLRRKRFGEAQQRMREALQVHRADVAILSDLINIANESHSDSPETNNRRAREVALQHLRVKLNRQYIRRWVRLLFYLGSKSLSGGWSAVNFSSRSIPNLVEEWALFLPSVVKYGTPTGQVSLQSQSRGLNFSRQLRYARENGRLMGHKLPSPSMRNRIGSRQTGKTSLVGDGDSTKIPHLHAKHPRHKFTIFKKD